MSPELLHAATGCGLMRAGLYAGPLSKAMQKGGITTPLRQAAFLAQIAHESITFSTLEENLNYRAEAIVRSWPNRFPTLVAAQPYARNPRALAEKVYAGRMGNTAPGDGYKYRGRGLIQLTGRENYAAYSADALARPDVLTTPEAAADCAAWYWLRNGCNAYADRRDWAGLTRRINGGTTGLADRVARTTRALKALGVV